MEITIPNIETIRKISKQSTPKPSEALAAYIAARIKFAAARGKFTVSLVANDCRAAESDEATWNITLGKFEEAGYYVERIPHPEVITLRWLLPST